MKVLLILVVLTPIIGFGQEVEYDDSYTLKGTTVLPWTEKYRTTYYQHGYYLHALTPSPCEMNGKRQEELEDQIHDARQSDSTITIAISKVGNCSDAFLGEIEIINDSIINLITHGYGGRSTCICCFGLEFVIETEGIKDQIRHTMINGKQTTLTEIVTD